MEQNNNNVSNISHPDYDPAKDPEVGADSVAEWLREWRDNLPYNQRRYVLIVGFTLLILLVVFLGYARGAWDVCSDLGGKMDGKLLHIECHPSQYNPPTETVNSNFTKGIIQILPTEK